MSRSWRIDRRTCLTAAGASLALPLLDAMGWADTAGGKAYKPPVRLGFMYMPHGVIMDQFWPADAENFLSSPPPALDSLRPVLDRMFADEGNLRSSHRSLQWGTARAGTVDLAHSNSARSR